MKQSIQINNTDIVIRPSSVDNSIQCGYQWAKVFLEGIVTIPNSRAAIGTGIHAGAEVFWNEAIQTSVKDPNLDMMTDAAIEAFQEEAKKGMRYDDGEDANTCEKEIVSGTQAYIDDLVPFLDIPTAVEKRYTVRIFEHPLVKAISGTVDYIAPGRIDDIKTSKRKPTTANYVTQQSIYKYLAEENGHPVHHQMIQGVVLKKQPDCHILEVTPNVDQAKYLVNNLLDKIEIAVKDIVPIETIFSCNTKYYLCSPKYCNLHGSCPATRKTANKAEKPML